MSDPNADPAQSELLERLGEMLALQTNELTGRLDKGLDEIGSGLSEFQGSVRISFEHLEAGLERLETRLDHLETRLDQLEIRLDQLETRLDQLETRLDQLETRLERLETRLERLETRLDQLEAGQIKIRTEIMDRIDRLQGTVELVQKDSRVNWATADTAMNRVWNSREDIDNLLAMITAMERRHQLLAAIVDGMRNPGTRKPDSSPRIN